MNLVTALLVVGLLAQYYYYRRIIKLLSWNKNLGCLTSPATELEGDRILTRERRRAKSGEIVMCVADIAALSELNDRIGEEGANILIRDLMYFLRTKRDVLLVGQKNSGDEFIWLCNVEDAESLCRALEYKSINLGFKGLYYTWSTIGPSQEFRSLSNTLMEEVYRIKKIKREQG